MVASGDQGLRHSESLGRSLAGLDMKHLSLVAVSSGGGGRRAQGRSMMGAGGVG